MSMPKLVRKEQGLEAVSSLPRIHPLALRLFRRVVRSYFRRHFRAVMLQGREHLQGRGGPLIVYGNHSSWWDPMLSILLAAELLPEAKHYAPIDAQALSRYPILGKLGLFPVELATARGAVNFLRTAESILSGGGVLWITPQGRFADPRSPLEFRPGLATLTLRMPQVPLVPLAVEYSFWNERLPEALSRCGMAFYISPNVSVDVATGELEEALSSEMAALREASCRREPQAFTTLLSGRRGSGGIYGLTRRLKAWVTGRRFQADHTQR